jgi:hypothetical protein
VIVLLLLLLLQTSEIPEWLREYMLGASQELYELQAFPRVLHGRSFRTAASFIFDSCHAVLLAVESRAGPERGRLSIASMDQVGLGFRVGVGGFWWCLFWDRTEVQSIYHLFWTASLHQPPDT